MKYGVEQGFITQLLVSKDLNTVVDNQIGLKFLNGTNKKAFKFIREHSAKYGKVPSLRVFKKKFRDYELYKFEGQYGTGEDLKYWCDELREKFKHNTLVDSTEKIYKNMEEMNTEEAYKVFKSTVQQIESEVILSGRISSTRNTSKRWQAYLERQKSGGMTGLPTGIEHWDELTGGLNKEELTCVMGFTGVGKSWLLIIIGVHLEKLGYKVLFFTTEMSKEMVMRRHDAVYCALNYTDFKKGKLKPDQQKRYKKYLDDAEGEPENFIVEQVVDGVSQIGAKIDSDKPEIVLVDGAYLMADEDTEDNWIGTVKVVRGLHKLCLNKHLPIVFTTQSKDEVGATLKSLQFAKAMAQDCDVVSVLEQDEQMRNDREIRWKPLKLREGDLLKSVYLNWDFNAMDYSSIYSEENSKIESAKKEDAKGVMLLD